MAIDFSEVLGMHGAPLKLRAERTRILAANLANETTPGYQARDIDFQSTLQQLRFAGEGIASPQAVSGNDHLLYRVPTQIRQDGNTVELGVEQAAFAQNLADWQTSLTFLNMRIAGLNKVIDGGR